MRNAFVVGGSGDIGSAIVRKLKKCGYNVIIGYFSNEAAAKKLGEETNSFSVYIDVSKKESVKSAFDTVRKNFGKIGVLINCAGVALKQAVLSDVSESDFDRVFAVNVKGVFNCSKEVVSDMLCLGRGDIINVSSVWGIDGASCEVVYSASKGAVNAFTKALADELAPSFIKVNAVAPSFVRTKMNAHLDEEDEKRFLLDQDLERLTTCEDVTEAVEKLLNGDETGLVVRIESRLK